MRSLAFPFSFVAAVLALAGCTVAPSSESDSTSTLTGARAPATTAEEREGARDGARDGAPGTAPEQQSARCAEVLAAVRPVVDAALPRARTQDVGVGIATSRCPFVGYSAGANAVGPDALWRVGSITKTYTAALVLDLVREGALRLDETIARFGLALPNEDRITVRQLLDHSSGLFDYTQDSTFLAHLDWTPEERLAFAASRPVYFEPGTSWRYSNTNYIALGFIAEQAAGGGADVASLIRTRILAPRGLDATFFAGEERLGGALAPSFLRSGAPVPASVGFIGAWADGAMAATLEDTTRWVRDYASGAATPTLTTDLFAGIQIPNAPLSYSLALFNLPPAATGDVAARGHGGDIPGFHSWSLHYAERGWTITAVINQDGGDVNAFLIAISGALKACASNGGC